MLADRVWVVDRHHTYVSFGRATDNMIVLGDGYASRHHGVVMHRGGKAVLLDASTNGTLIVQRSGLTIAAHREAAVLEGEGTIRLGCWRGGAIDFAVTGSIAPSAFAPVPDGDGTTAHFRFEDDRWSLAFDGRVLLVKDSLGLHYLARLLSRPGEDIDALDLLLSANPTAATTERADDVRNAGAAQRARVAVTSRIKAAIRKLVQCHPPLGHHLRAHVRTGRACRYGVDPRALVHWSF